MATSLLPDHPIARRILLALGIFVAFILVLLLVVSLLSDRVLKHFVEGAISSKTGREAKIDGPMHLHIWSWTPGISMDGFSLGNANWVPDRPMLAVRHFEATVTWMSLLKFSPVFPRVQIDGPDIDLERDAMNRANWDFSSPGASKPSPAKPSGPLRFPAIKQLLLSDGRLRASDAIRKLKFTGDISISEQGREAGDSATRVRGSGTLNGKPFDLRVSGGPLFQVEPDKPYSFDAQVSAADIKLDATTEIHKAFDLGSLTSKIHLSGRDLSDFYYLTGLALPNTPPYDITGLVRRDQMKFAVDEFKGRLGKSDIHGKVSVDTGKERPLLTAELTSSLLNLADLATPLGTQASAGNKVQTLAATNPAAQSTNPRSKPNKRARAAVAAVDAQATETGYLLPDADLQMDRVRGMDADVKLEAAAVQTEKMPIKKVRFHLTLNEGRMKLDPLEFTLPEGSFAGEVSIDAHAAVPVTDLDMRLKNLNLAQFKTKSNSSPPLEGEMVGRVRLHGQGTSVHKTAATASGDLTVVMPHGQMRAAFAELTGINVAKGLGLLLSKDEQSTEIRCGIASFHAEQGDLKANSLLIDTTHVLVTGSGHVNLKDEGIRVELRGKPKQIRLVRLKTPIEVGGTLAHPSIGLEPGHLATQAGAAAALGVVLTPAAALLAFVDGGLAKDANCTAVTSEGDARAR